jgi:RNA polymerase sigma factor (sigma-70 family)
VTKPAPSPQYQGVDEPDRPSGDWLADFDALYDREYAYVWKTLARLGVAPADLADGVHDVFVVVHLRRAELDRERPIRPWLFGVARRVAAAQRRKRHDEPVAEPEAAAAPDVAPERELLWKALDQLDDDRRVVIILHDLEGHTGAEIARDLGIPVNTVHSRLRLGRADLVAALERLGRIR